nr:hypothetical protein [Tanacetum cinerariifolium]
MWFNSHLFVVFLPNILDSKPEGWNKFLLLVAEKFKTRPYASVWAIAEELELQHHDIQRITAENRHVVEETLDARARDLTDRGMKLEVELRKTKPLRADASHLRYEGQKLNSLRQLLSNQLQTLIKDTNRSRVENE